jgi:hypothetical protein
MNMQKVSNLLYVLMLKPHELIGLLGPIPRKVTRGRSAVVSGFCVDERVNSRH